MSDTPQNNADSGREGASQTSADYSSLTRAVYGHEGTMNSTELHYTGFGIFASQAAGAQPDLMYNQKVDFTFVGDMGPSDPEHPELGTLKGFWSYSPLKYWPTNLTGVYFCAYAPYVEKPAASVQADASNTGIIGMSSNTDTTPYVLYRRALKPEDNVDLLWCYQSNFAEREAVNFRMYHALARLAVSVKLADASTIDLNSNKVLIRSITLTGTMTKEAKLILNEDNIVSGEHYPTWQELVPAVTEDRTITIDNSGSGYGIIAEDVRYINDLPYAWQPAGLKKEAGAGVPANALSYDGHQEYIFLIPQTGGLTLTPEVQYTIVPSSGSHVNKTATLTSGTISVPATGDLKGNKTYHLTLKITVNA